MNPTGNHFIQFKINDIFFLNNDNGTFVTFVSKSLKSKMSYKAESAMQVHLINISMIFNV